MASMDVGIPPQTTAARSRLEILRRRAYALVEPVSEDGISSRIDWFDRFIIILIVLNVAAVVLGTLPGVEKAVRVPLHDFEVFSIVVFTVEYVLRLWSCVSNPRYARPVLGRLRLAASPLALVDLLAILPFYIPIILPMDLRVLRAVRVFRIFRLFKLGRYSESLKIIGAVIRSRKSELAVTFFLIFILLVLSSSLLFYAERGAQPEKFSSIPASMWWGVVTLTTVGYGDVYPLTPLGKVFGSIISFLGIGLFALPTGILAAGFLEEFRKKRGGETICPHCGRKI